ncbi:MULTISPECIES: hypothetical protein, partial [unclassified Pseudomonas]|uniref:hypothetical protein n=1 Tax=unclassified Pseudomonas TaxID=196821 RepID=UPI0019D5E9BF
FSEGAQDALGFDHRNGRLLAIKSRDCTALGAMRFTLGTGCRLFSLVQRLSVQSVDQLRAILGEGR